MRDFGEFGVLLYQRRELSGLFRQVHLTLCACMRQVFAMPCVRVGQRLVPVCLARLGKQDQRCRVGSLKAECEVEQDERIDVELGNAEDIYRDPRAHDQGLRDEEAGRAEDARKRLRLQRKPVIAEDPRQMRVRDLESEVMVGVLDDRGLILLACVSGVHEMPMLSKEWSGK